MQYVMMSIEEACKLVKKNVVVLVATRDLENDDCNCEFTKMNAVDCDGIIHEAETIARQYDEFINRLQVFTKNQIDIVNYEPRGKLSTILLKS